MGTDSNCNTLLNRKYYEYDNAFFKAKANISCWEQMEYQSLREYDVDYFLVFCDDINIQILENGTDNYTIYPNWLNYNQNLFHYTCVTENASEAESVIRQIIGQGKVVIFQTASDYLHTSVWYHEKEPYTRRQHNAILVGYDDDSFFYVDSPPMRNPDYFIPHKDNPAVGCISKTELIEAFRYHCQIGYIDIEESGLNEIADICKILKGIKENYTEISDRNLTGRKALEKLSEVLRSDHEIKGIFDDPFPFDLIAARHKRLLITIGHYPDLLKSLNEKELSRVLAKLVEEWRKLENMVIKYQLQRNIEIQHRMSQRIQDEIIPLTDKFMELLGATIERK